MLVFFFFFLNINVTVNVRNECGNGKILFFNKKGNFTFFFLFKTRCVLNGEEKNERKKVDNRIRVRSGGGDGRGGEREPCRHSIGSVSYFLLIIIIIFFFYYSKAVRGSGINLFFFFS